MAASSLVGHPALRRVLLDLANHNQARVAALERWVLEVTLKPQSR